MTDRTANEIISTDGWAIAPSLDSLGEGMFRPVRKALAITAFGMNAKVMQPGSSSKTHWHTEQQEVIFVHEGSIRVEFGAGAAHELGPGAIVRISPNEPHTVTVTSDTPAVIVMMGGKDGIVEGDAVFPPSD